MRLWLRLAKRPRSRPVTRRRPGQVRRWQPRLGSAGVWRAGRPIERSAPAMAGDWSRRLQPAADTDSGRCTDAGRAASEAGTARKSTRQPGTAPPRRVAAGSRTRFRPTLRSGATAWSATHAPANHICRSASDRSGAGHTGGAVDLPVGSPASSRGCCAKAGAQLTAPAVQNTPSAWALRRAVSAGRGVPSGLLIAHQYSSRCELHVGSESVQTLITPIHGRQCSFA